MQFLTPEQIKEYWKKLPYFTKRIYLETARQEYTDAQSKRLLKEFEKSLY